MTNDPLDDIKEELKTINERSQATKANLQVLTAIVNQRHDNYLITLTNIWKSIETLSAEIKILSKKVDNLNSFADSGKASVRTVLLVITITTTILGTIAAYRGWIF